MSHFINIGLLFSFTALAVSGILSFIQPFSIDVTRVHIVFGFVTIILVGLHLWKKINYFKKQFSVKPKVFGIVFLMFGLLLYVSIENKFPAQQILNQSYESKYRKEIIRPAPVVATMENKSGWVSSRQKRDHEETLLSVHVSLEKDLPVKPTIAIWAETKVGTMIETLYISEDLAYSDRPIWNGKETQRHKVLPIWRHRYTSVTGIDPEGKVDAMTGATENHSFSLDNYINTSGDEYLIFIEVNVPSDSNEAWPDTHIGQPSILYSAYVEHREGRKYTMLEMTGHGGAADKSGEIYYDLESITTAKELIDLVLVHSRSVEE